MAISFWSKRTFSSIVMSLLEAAEEAGAAWESDFVSAADEADDEADDEAADDEAVDEFADVFELSEELEPLAAVIMTKTRMIRKMLISLDVFI